MSGTQAQIHVAATQAAAPRAPALNGVLLWRAFRKLVLPVLLAGFVLLIWQVGVQVTNVSALLIVPPSVVWQTLAQDWPVLLQQAMPTLIDTVVGFALAALVGSLLGAVMTLSHRVHQAINPHVVLFQLIPKVALAPLFIVWLGVGPTSRLAFALFLAFFPMVVATSTGLMSADRNAVRLCQSLTASRLQTFLAVRIPYAVPHIFAGLKISVTMAMIGVIVGEFVTAQQGLGYIIMFASSAGETALVFAAIVLLCVIGLVLYGLVELAEMLVRRRLGVSITTTEF
jgi:NitT/TauT family transport system permease protein